VRIVSLVLWVVSSLSLTLLPPSKSRQSNIMMPLVGTVLSDGSPPSLSLNMGMTISHSLHSLWVPARDHALV
jgi:hypothetical protein